MPRPRKCRKVCRMPQQTCFSPFAECEDFIFITVDEYEALRLIDYQGFSQQQCGEYMQIARATVQLIYDSARKKIATALVNGWGIKIKGGDFVLCDGGEASCHCGGCSTHSQQKAETAQGDYIMKIAVTYDNGMIFQHFGHTEFFKVYTIEDSKLVKSQVLPTNGSGHGALAGFLAANGVDALICGGIGGGAQNALAQLGIKVYGGVKGNADMAAAALAAGRLNYDPAAKCDHHDHHGHDHDCGSHDHGHSCGGGKCHE